MVVRDKLDGKKCFKYTGIKRPAKVLARSLGNSRDEGAVGEAANTDTELPACSGLFPPETPHTQQIYSKKCPQDVSGG